MLLVLSVRSNSFAYCTNADYMMLIVLEKKRLTTGVSSNQFRSSPSSLRKSLTYSTSCPSPRSNIHFTNRKLGGRWVRFCSVLAATAFARNASSRLHIPTHQGHSPVHDNSSMIESVARSMSLSVLKPEKMSFTLWIVKEKITVCSCPSGARIRAYN